MPSRHFSLWLLLWLVLFTTVTMDVAEALAVVMTEVNDSGGLLWWLWLGYDGSERLGGVM